MKKKGLPGKIADRPLLYFVSDGGFASGRSLLSIVKKAVAGGAGMVQLRAKEAPVRDFLRDAELLAAWLRPKGIPFIVNDRLDIALACGADGLHLGGDDMPIGDARRVAGKTLIIGASCHTVAQAKRAEKEGADYIGVGQVFPTGTKGIKSHVIGGEKLAEICRAVSIPVMAIGGITPENAGAVMESGCDGVAVLSGIMAAADPKKTARRIADAIHGAGRHAGRGMASGGKRK